MREWINNRERIVKIMDVKIVDLPEISIIGKEGLCTENSNIVQELWSEANSHFDEVAELGMREKDGSFVGFWGAMSDETMSFLPWTNHFSRGLYLAGIEVNHDAVAPSGWQKWNMPPRKCIIVDVQMDQYEQTFSEVLNRVIPDMNLELCGAVCDYTEPATGKNKLLFPVTMEV